jgi:hydrogenase expression/formation protein HypE
MNGTLHLPHERPRNHRARVSVDRINLSHGAGGKAMRDLINDVFVSSFGASLGALEDQARLPLQALLRHGLHHRFLRR